MRLSALRRVQLLLLASFALCIGPAPSGAAGDPAAASLVSQEVIDVCEPNRDCRRACFAKSKAFYKECVNDGNPRRECRHKAVELRKLCIESKCTPTLDCKDRCIAQGKRLLWRCLEAGGDEERCRAEAEMAIEACVEQNCPGCFCPQVYDPVCGVDGMTYGNACEAGCANVPIAYEGPCEPRCEPLPCDVYCPYGHKLDADGCPTCECNPPPGCESDADCRDGQTCREICSLRPCSIDDPDCNVCVGICVPRPIICDDRPICGVYCPSGYRPGPDGCPTCDCLDPIPPILIEGEGPGVSVELAP